ncbi:proline-rich protein PRCC [Venturia canescens]|uniref:proline-rich protein PRCC n=1 Tax=Venturia canescens TaxID=32260 RepID=UPI001C9BE7D3|nr:proline-rich protein PRCC [Venturia canescens]
MSLVAYGSSDESSDDEVNPEAKGSQKNVEDELQNKSSNVTVDFSKSFNTLMNLPAPKNPQIPSENHSNGNAEVTSGTLGFGALPKPKNFQNEYQNVPEDDDIPLFKPKQTVVEVPMKKDRTPARISIPSLSEFKDVDEDLENSKHRPIASKKGTGLFSILPPPKSEVTIKKNNLIPHVLTKAGINAGPKTTVSKVPVSKPEKPREIKIAEKQVPRLLTTMDYDSNSEDEEETHQDFFSLSKPVNSPEIPVLPKTTILMSTVKNNLKNPSTVNNHETGFQSTVENLDTSKSVTTPESDQGQNSTLISTVMNLPREEILLKNKAEVGPKLPVPEQEFNVDAEGNVAFDEKAIEYLCGKRGVKRKNKMIEEANIIEINGEDIKPDEREWLVKAMTEEPVQRPVSMQGAGPSSQSKKKHQITYLAHQAKAMEVELKNTWSQNRMARKQTQSKYGF